MAEETKISWQPRGGHELGYVEDCVETDKYDIPVDWHGYVEVDDNGEADVWIPDHEEEVWKIRGTHESVDLAKAALIAHLEAQKESTS